MVNQDTARYADIFAALGSEPRLEIMRSLFAAYPEGMTVSDIQAKLQIPNSTLSHHLEKLRIEGLVNSIKDKQYHWYSANAETMEDLLSFLYTGRSIRGRVNEPVNVSSREEGFMFQKFFEPIFERLFGGSTFQKILEPLPLHAFTEKAIAAIRLAQNESRRLGHQHIGTEQILLGVIGEGTGIAAQVLTAVGVNFEQVQSEVEKIIGRGRGTMSGEIPFTPRGKRALEFSLEASRQLGHHAIGTEHLLLGILRERDGLGAIVLQNLGVDIQNLEQQVQGAMS